MAIFCVLGGHNTPTTACRKATTGHDRKSTTKCLVIKHTDVPKPNGTTARSKNPSNRAVQGGYRSLLRLAGLIAITRMAAGLPGATCVGFWAKPHPETPRRTLQNQLESSGMDKTAACPVSVMTATPTARSRGRPDGAAELFAAAVCHNTPWPVPHPGREALDFHANSHGSPPATRRTMVRHAKLRQRRTHRPQGAVPPANRRNPVCVGKSLDTCPEVIPRRPTPPASAAANRRPAGRWCLRLGAPGSRVLALR